ncbi:hypothetical protein M430DRAFT_241002 [Amorphotheca resinae ATCC 22711]|uniref:Uncharacterized protein n=1 Tax=Amorphotheca resinae ATCC 22711 TaxID=857342 RepID=A0A2T3B1V5_AMORE|nr:hypothetical protein M430DRAFT_241002 [Amorphotheca resinae ATCC 22711]PSS18541.1 hypothetical protein M430DRAFT_241002 [Amorphotheca resinae ATCC 22711]
MRCIIQAFPLSKAPVHWLLIYWAGPISLLLRSAVRLRQMSIEVCICDPGLGQSGGSAYATPISSQQHILVTNNLVAFSPRSPHLLLYIQSRHGCYKKRFVVRTKTVLLLFLPGAPRTPKRPAKLVLTCHRVRSMVVTGETDEPISRWLK